jgi:hypothetical protein
VRNIRTHTSIFQLERNGLPQISITFQTVVYFCYKCIIEIINDLSLLFLRTWAIDNYYVRLLLNWNDPFFKYNLQYQVSYFYYLQLVLVRALSEEMNQ